MSQYFKLAEDFARLLEAGKHLPLGNFPPQSRPAVAAEAPVALIFSPHPDDEVIIGGLALRLLREADWRIINVAVTQGSNRTRQAARWNELRDCCKNIGFELVATAPQGLEKINLKTRQADPRHWEGCVAVIAGLLRQHAPRAIFFPHDNDWNSSHIGTHHLVVDALNTLPDFSTCTIETEFWAAMTTPNLMVELNAQHLGSLMTALSFHVGEVQRNPYHLSLPAWMSDNVRRGSEIVGGQGGVAPDFTFATLYRLRQWQQRGFVDCQPGGRTLACGVSAADLFA
jgi:LmbE family N-acetylglucosaminyl deacetylase